MLVSLKWGKLTTNSLGRIGKAAGRLTNEIEAGVCALYKKRCLNCGVEVIMEFRVQLEMTPNWGLMLEYWRDL